MKKINKRLIGEFVSSMNISNLPHHYLDFDEFFAEDIAELDNQVLVVTHDGRDTWIAPYRIWGDNIEEDEDDYTYGIEALVWDGWSVLTRLKWVPTWQELSDMLEEKKFCAKWVSEVEIDEALEHIPDLK